VTTVSVTDFALHIQNYLDQVMQGEKIRIHLQNEQFISLVAESAIAQPLEKKYTKDDLLKKLSYQGSQTDSQQIDELIYPGS
jgi:antitoxin (DNA-binding transcriptional repressor) of toxin-antitoxin stability system